MIGRINKSQDGIVFDVTEQCQTLSAGHGNVPKILINESENSLRERSSADHSGGGRSSKSKKHCWDLVMIKQDNIKVGTWRTHKDGNGFREVSNSDCPTIPARARTDGSGQPAIIVASRGRNSENATEQRLEPNTDGISNTLTSVERDNYLLQNYRIRRLTEIECERLQGFPDNHTAFGKYDGIIKPISKTQRYKMMGNAVTRKIVQKVGEKLLKCL